MREAVPEQETVMQIGGFCQRCNLIDMLGAFGQGNKTQECIIWLAAN